VEIKAKITIRKVVPAAGVEPATFRSGGERSNPLSYAGTLNGDEKITHQRRTVPNEVKVGSVQIGDPILLECGGKLGISDCEFGIADFELLRVIQVRFHLALGISDLCTRMNFAVRIRNPKFRCACHRTPKGSSPNLKQ
jgi:hypothetical protein